MKKRSIGNTAAAAVILLLVCVASSAAFAQKATVLRVVVVKTDDPAAYAQEIEKGRQVMKSLGVQGQTRVWQARFAGPDAGMVVATHRVSQHGGLCRRRRQDQRQQRIPGLGQGPGQDQKDCLRQPLHRMVAR